MLLKKKKKNQVIILNSQYNMHNTMSCTKQISVLNVLWQCLHYNIQHCDFTFVE